MHWLRPNVVRWNFPGGDPVSRRRKWEEDEAPPVRPGFWNRTRYLAGVVFALLAILYGAAQAMARTAGFRDLLSERLEARFGLPVKIESSAVNWRFDLTLQNLVTEGARRPDSPGLRAQRIHLAWSWDRWWRNGVGLRALELDRCVMVLVRQEDGMWAPREFQGLSDVLGPWLEFDLKPATGVAKAASSEAGSQSEERPADPVVAWADRFKASGLRVALTRGDIQWWDGGDVPRASVQGVGLWLTPVAVPGRTVQHLKLTVQEALARTGDRVRNLRVEVLDVGSQQVVLGLEAERQQVAPGLQIPRP